MKFGQWVERLPEALDPRQAPPQCFLVVAPNGRAARKSAHYDKTVTRLEAVVEQFTARIFGLPVKNGNGNKNSKNGNGVDYDCPDLDVHKLLPLFQQDPEDARRMLANYFLALMGSQNLALFPRERCGKASV